MNQDQITALVQSLINQAQSSAQFQVTKNGYHIHNGVDSPLLPVTELWGVVTLSSGSATITDPRIKASSVIVATSTVSHTYAGVTAYTLGASCTNGSASIFGQGPVATDPVNYIIRL